MNHENEERDNCVQSIIYGVNRTASWRDKIFERYHDQRNVWAANALRKLAGDAPNLSDELWLKLQPHFSWESETFRDAVSTAARQIGFAHRSKSFPFFIKNLLDIVSNPTGSVAA